MEIKSFVFNDFQENTILIFDESKECIIIDPGCNNDHEYELITNFISDKQLKPVKIINTHCHVDHILGVNFMKQLYNVPFYAHQDEELLIQNISDFSLLLGLDFHQEVKIDAYIKEDDIIEFGNSKVNILHTPGHSMGSVCFYSAEKSVLISGDTLFSGSIGRTDLPGGNYNTLMLSIKNKILNLPDDTVVYPGHGPLTIIKQETATNPFLLNNI
jgi:hydroxyacylglutathione hydrolase